MIIAITVVLSAPVASFNAIRGRPGLASLFTRARCSIYLRRVVSRFEATSVSQIRLSTASTWQKKGRTDVKLSGSRQKVSRSAVAGDTPQSAGFGRLRQASASPRRSLTMVESYF